MQFFYFYYFDDSYKEYIPEKNVFLKKSDIMILITQILTIKEKKELQE